MVFNSERLKPIIESPGEKLIPIAAEKRLNDLQHTLTLVDGSIVCRIRDNSVFTVLEERLLTDADRAARVLSDQLISLGSDNAEGKPNHRVRLVVIEAKPHNSRGKPGTGSTDQNCDGFLRIATKLLDVPVEIIALLYHYRLQIETFFRFFMHLLDCRHLLSALSTAPNALTMSTVWGFICHLRYYVDQVLMVPNEKSRLVLHAPA